MERTVRRICFSLGSFRRNEGIYLVYPDILVGEWESETGKGWQSVSIRCHSGQVTTNIRGFILLRLWETRLQNSVFIRPRAQIWSCSWELQITQQFQPVCGHRKPGRKPAVVMQEHAGQGVQRGYDRTPTSAITYIKRDNDSQITLQYISSTLFFVFLVCTIDECNYFIFIYGLIYSESLD